MKKILLLSLFSFLFSFTFAASSVDRLFVQVKPNAIKPNEAADLIIKAFDKGGNVVKDYQSSIVIEVEGLSEKDVTLPGDGFYDFLPEDQGQKTFSKGLIFKKEGEFKVTVTDILDSSEKIKGEATVSVKTSGSSSSSQGTITVVSPINGSTEKGPTLNIVGTSSLTNSPFEIYLDKDKVEDGLTDDQGGINVTLESVKSGEHQLIIKMQDADGKDVGESTPVSFSISGSDTTSDLFKSVSITPSDKLNQGDKVVIILTTLDSVTSSELLMDNMGSFPMDKDGKGKFKKELVMDKEGKFSVGFKLTANDNTKEYKDKANISVAKVEKKAIKEVKFTKNQKNKIDLEWTYEGTINKFKVLYGTGKDSLSGELIVDKNKATLDNINELVPYFVQISPADATGGLIGTPSEVIVIEANTKAAATCKVKGIKITTIQEGDKYFLTWKKVDGAKKYVIYRSENGSGDIKSMQKIGETADLRFEYPFDPKAKKEAYAYYAVEAECEDGSKLQIDSVKKVKVGPFDTMIFIILLSSLIYLTYRLYNYSR